MKRNLFISAILAVLMLAACTDALVDEGGKDVLPDNGEGIGEMVLFTAGRTVEQLATRATDMPYEEIPGETYFMDDQSRFVCRMYYKAQMNSDLYDISTNTKTVSWLKVNGEEGNSVYWNKQYNDLSDADKLNPAFKDYGFDPNAPAFYWQNRKEHAFVAWTDLSKAKNSGYKYGRDPGMLKVEPDVEYEEHTGTTGQSWVYKGRSIMGVPDMQFTNTQDLCDYAIDHFDVFKDSDSQKNYASISYSGGDSYRYDDYIVKYSYEHQERINQQYDENEVLYAYSYGPIKYWIYNTPIHYIINTEAGDAVDNEPDISGKTWVRRNSVKVALLISEEGQDPVYAEVDNYGRINYDESHPTYEFFVESDYELEEGEIINRYDALKFDLTSTGKTSIAEQPDICRALTKMAPEGYTQAANRVHLYFKHQFSQVQVNLKSSSDNSVKIDPENIKKVELLGVTEEGYVFVDLNTNGTLLDAAYKEVDISAYTEAQIANNSFGTSFSMFDMGTGNYAPNYLKSFNAITFGLLQAIRITWEEKSSQISHVATFKVTDQNLRNLKSGVKYIWNIELQRGTLAVVSTEIENWRVPKNNGLTYGTSGTISD